MMIPVDPNNYQSIIGNVHSLAGTYYSDEPFHTNCPSKNYKPEWDGKLYMLSVIRDYAHAHGAKYAVSHYFECPHVVEYKTSVDILMYDGYTDNVSYGDCFYVDSEDQRDALTNWLNIFGNQASGFWMGTGITVGNSDNDDNEFGQLFGWANNKGYLTGGGQIWLYCGPSATENNVSLFSSKAYENGWIKRYMREWGSQYKCIVPEGTYTFPPGPDWLYMGEVSTNIVEER